MINYYYKIYLVLSKLFHGVNADVFAKTYDMQCIGLRYFNVFGKRQDPNGAYALLAYISETENIR